MMNISGSNHRKCAEVVDAVERCLSGDGTSLAKVLHGKVRDGITAIKMFDYYFQCVCDRQFSDWSMEDILNTSLRSHTNRTHCLFCAIIIFMHVDNPHASEDTIPPIPLAIATELPRLPAMVKERVPSTIHCDQMYCVEKFLPVDAFLRECELLDMRISDRNIKILAYNYISQEEHVYKLTRLNTLKTLWRTIEPILDMQPKATALLSSSVARELLSRGGMVSPDAPSAARQLSRAICNLTTKKLPHVIQCHREKRAAVSKELNLILDQDTTIELKEFDSYDEAIRCFSVCGTKTKGFIDVDALQFYFDMSNPDIMDSYKGIRSSFVKFIPFCKNLNVEWPFDTCQSRSMDLLLEYVCLIYSPLVARSLKRTLDVLHLTTSSAVLSINNQAVTKVISHVFGKLLMKNRDEEAIAIDIASRFVETEHMFVVRSETIDPIYGTTIPNSGFRFRHDFDQPTPLHQALPGAHITAQSSPTHMTQFQKIPRFHSAEAMVRDEEKKRKVRGMMSNFYKMRDQFY